MTDFELVDGEEGGGGLRICFVLIMYQFDRMQSKLGSLVKC